MDSRDGLRVMSEPYSLEPVVLLNEVFPGHTNSMDTLYAVSYTHLRAPET